MGKSFAKITYDPTRCRTELRAFGKLLKLKPDLSEQQDITPFFKSRKQLSAFFGTLSSEVGPAPELAFDYSFLGDFSADLVVGNRKHNAYLAIEFEDGRTNSIFKKVRSRSTTDWSSRFEHGYSQLIDWFCTLDDYKKTDKFRKEFGDGHITFSGLLIVGRNSGVSDADRLRLAWRRNKVLVDSRSISCITFDELYESLQARLDFYPVASGNGK